MTLRIANANTLSGNLQLKNILIFYPQGDAGSSAAGIKVEFTPQLYSSFGYE